MSARLDLPDVTLCCVETREWDLARMAIQDCKRKVDFGDVLIFTDKPEKFEKEGRIVVVEDFPDKVDWSRFRWQEISPHLKTSHMLFTEWDAWVSDPSMWRNDFLQYDFIGAPWWFSDGRNVGNGGFSMRSTALTRYLRKNRDKFPCTTCVDDDLLCRKYRLQLESLGFTWAPEKLAYDFAFECIRPSPESKHFGFHGMFNWHWILNEDELFQRAEVASRSDYIRTRERMWGAFCKNNPKIAERLAS
jgi:hypothetical protein